MIRAIFLLLLSANAYSQEAPTFDQYTSGKTFNGLLKSIDFSSHKNASTFKTRLNNLIGQKPNFSSTYIITLWGCGSSCQQFALVNAKNGDVFIPNITASYGICFKLKSNLLIVNPLTQDLIDGLDDKTPVWLKTKYFKWDGEVLNSIHETQKPIDVEC